MGSSPTKSLTIEQWQADNKVAERMRKELKLNKFESQPFSPQPIRRRDSTRPEGRPEGPKKLKRYENISTPTSRLKRYENISNAPSSRLKRYENISTPSRPERPPGGPGGQPSRPRHRTRTSNVTGVLGGLTQLEEDENRRINKSGKVAGFF